jgi:TatD DNase family protein
MIIDTHCHLSDVKFAKDLEDVIESSHRAGVEKMIAMSVDVKDSKNVIEISKRNAGVFPAIGICYSGARRNINVDLEMDKMRRLAKNSNVVAIGEIGIDCLQGQTKKNLEKQREIFEAQLKLAMELDLPVVIHSRGAERQIREVLDGLQGVALKGQFHCFGESKEFLEYVLGLGFYVSFGGNVTYKSADNLRNLLKMVPLERLLLETDSPYLPPEGKRGERNTPENAIITVRFIADFLNISFESLAYQTSKNAKCLFSLS